MGEDDLGPWQPATTAELAALFAGAPFRWWMTGGVALELHLGRSWRGHADADVGICRRDAPAVHRWLAGLDLHVAAGGRLRPWDGAALSAAAEENNVWARPTPHAPWRFDIAVGEGDAERWTYRRDPAVSRAWEEALLSTPAGVPYLAPEIQLLFKSKALRPKDDLDAEVVIPALDGHRRRWLAGHLPAGHPWLGWTGAAG